MPIGTLLLALALFMIVAALVALPFFERKTPVTQAPSVKEKLDAERRAVVRAIRELDMDFRTQKLSEDDYQALRQTQVQRGTQILRELDALKQRDTSIDAEIEGHIAQHIAKLSEKQAKSGQ